MDQRQFLASVVPWENNGDYVTISWRYRSDQGKYHWVERFVRTLDDALKLINALIPGQNDIYVCLSSQRKFQRNRHGSNASALSSVWSDIDINTVPQGHEKYDPDKYDSVPAAVEAVWLFCKAVGIPNPSLVVLSGGGIHVYWLSKGVLSVAEWKVYAEALKAAIKAHGLKADAGLTTDVVRVLRVIQTPNRKYDPPPPVRLWRSGCNWAKHDFKAIFANLLTAKPASPEQLLPAPAFRHLDPNDRLGKSIEFDTRPIPLQPILKECGFLREAWETGGKAFGNPAWNQVNLICTFLEDGEKLIHRLGDQHPGYSYEDTNKQWERKNQERKSNPRLGWPSCKTIQDTGCKHCAACPHLILGKSPLYHGFAVAKPVVVDEDEEMAALGGERPPELRLPEGFCRNKSTLKLCAIIRGVTVGNKTKAGRLLPLFNGQFSDVSLYTHGDQMGIAVTCTTDRSGTVNLFVPVGMCCDQSKLYNFMSKHNVGHIADKEIEAMGVKFMSSWLDLLQTQDVAVRDQGVMGWQYDGDGKRAGFAYGGKLYRVDGTTTTLRVVADDEFHSWYMPAGKREVWLQAADLLISRRQPALDVIIALAFAAPLTAFVGTLYGAILSVWGDPGTAKSTAQQVAAAVWGHPKQTRESLTSTPKSVQGRLGRTRNLPAYWDDVQDERHQEALFQTMFVASEGTEGGRLNSDATYKKRLDWQTLLVACSNASFVEYLTKKQKSTTAGIRRVFEIEFRKDASELGMIDAHDASRTFALLEHNYGVIGAEYATLLAHEHAAIDALMVTTMRRFGKTVSAAGDESFWLGICATLLVGATLANKLGTKLDVTAMEGYLAHTFLYNRSIRRDEGSEAGTYVNTERALTDFLNTFARGNALFTDKSYRYRHESIKPLNQIEGGRPVYIQIARDERLVRISKKAMRDYLWKNEYQPKPIFEGMKKWLGALEVKNTLGGGSVYAQTQETCFEITVPIGKLIFLEGLLNAYGKAE